MRVSIDMVNEADFVSMFVWYSSAFGLRVVEAEVVLIVVVIVLIRVVADAFVVTVVELEKSSCFCLASAFPFLLMPGHCVFQRSSRAASPGAICRSVVRLVYDVGVLA